MTDRKFDRTLAIVGLGPRGLGALEALAADAIDRKLSVKVDIFDATNAVGAGPNFHPDESALCLLNIPVRVLDIDPPRIVRDEIAPFAKWSGADYNLDDFPPRCDLGEYLMARFKALCGVTEAFFDTSLLNVTEN